MLPLIHLYHWCSTWFMQWTSPSSVFVSCYWHNRWTRYISVCYYLISETILTNLRASTSTQTFVTHSRQYSSTMPLDSSKPDNFSSPGYPEGQHLPASYTNMNGNVLQLLDRVDSLEKLVCRLHEQLHQLQSPFHTPAQSTHANSCLLVNNATQTDTNDYDTTPMDLEILSEKIRQCQNQDKDIGTLKYFINRNIMPKAKEISNFQPRMRRYLWQLSRFVVQDDIVYRKRMNSDRVTATLQLVVPSNLVPDVLRTFHPPVGHVTLQRTLENTTKHMFWPFMQRDITNFSNTCNICHNARTGPETSLPHDQTPSSMIQKAVCAITELTKDFINCTSSRNDQPHAKHKSMRPRKRSRKNTQLRSQNAGIHHHSPPANNHPNLPPQKAQTHISPPRDQPHSAPEGLSQSLAAKRTLASPRW